MGAARAIARASGVLEGWLEAERDQLILWLPVMLGAGITAWFVLPDAGLWIGFLLASAAIALAGIALSGAGRAPRVAAIGAVTMMAGCALEKVTRRNILVDSIGDSRSRSRARSEATSPSGRSVLLARSPATTSTPKTLRSANFSQQTRWVAST